MAEKITFNDKSHINPYGTREIQVWDLDINEIKQVVNANADETAANTANVKTNAIAKKTLAEIQALTPDNETLYYVLDDPTPSNNGAWGWDTPGWYKAADTVNAGAFNDTDNVTPATQKSIGDWVKALTPTVNNSDFDDTDNVLAATQKSTGDYVKGITDNKADLQVGTNMFDKSVATIGYFISPTSGNLSASSTYDTTDYIPILPESDYTANTVGAISFSCYFDADKNVVLGGSTPTTTNFTSPENAYFVRISFTHPKLDTFQLQKGFTITEYEPYNKSVPNSQLEEAKKIFREATSISPLDLDETNWATKGKNIFNVDTIDAGYFVSWSNGNLAASASYDTSAFIEVLPNTDYVFSGSNTRSYAIYNSAKTFVSGDQYPSTINTGSDGHFIKVSYGDGEGSVFQVEQGTTPTGYEHFGYLAPLLIVEATVSSFWNNTETNYLGDSITAQNQWQPIVNGTLGLAGTNFGIGGSKISGTSTDSFNNDVRVNALSDTAKLVVVLGGTNDWVQGVSMGSEDSTTITEFYGGLNVLIEKLLTKYNTSGVLTQFVFGGTPYGEMLDWESRFWPNSYTNAIGLTSKDYAEAIRKRCLFYGIPFCDNSNLGWNTINIRDYITDDGGLLHPNSNGGHRLGSVMVGKLRSLEPLQV